MIPYFVFLFLVLYFYYKGNYKGIMFVLTFFSVVRYNVGWDYTSYYDIALNPLGNPNYYRFSFLWQEIFLFAYKYHCPSFAISFPSLLICITVFTGIYLLLDGYRYNICDALIIYSLWPFFYIGSFTTTRQSLAVGVCLIIYALLKKRKFLLAICLYVLNVSIHPSSAVAIIIFPIFIWNIELKFKSISIISLLSFYVAINFQSLALQLPMYNYYVEMEDDYGGLMSLLLILMSLWLIYSLYQSKKKNKEIAYIGVVIISLLTEATIYSLGISSIVARIFSYFSILLVFVIIESVKIVNPKLKKVVICLFASLFIWYLFHTEGAQEASGYIPYKTLFFK